METTNTAPAVPRLRRTLTLWDLIFYGIVLIQPIAPVPLYGVAQKLSDGHFVTIILIALFAMLITAVSYGRMHVSKVRKKLGDTENDEHIKTVRGVGYIFARPREKVKV